jgi:hypothetical protein
MTMADVATWAVPIGLVLTAIGAAVTAKTVIITDQQAAMIARTPFDSNEALSASLRQQSRGGQRGLWLIFAGTALQLIGTVIPLFH